jgi:hypothetical protein
VIVLAAMRVHENLSLVISSFLQFHQNIVNINDDVTLNSTKKRGVNLESFAVKMLHKDITKHKLAYKDITR